MNNKVFEPIDAEIVTGTDMECENQGQNMNGMNMGHQNQGQYGNNMNGQYQNQSQHGNNMNGGYQNQDQYGNNMNGGYQNQGQHGNNMNGGYQNQDQYGNNMNGGYQNQGQHGNNMNSGYQNQGQYGNNMNGGYQNQGQHGNNMNGGYQNQGQYMNNGNMGMVPAGNGMPQEVMTQQDAFQDISEYKQRLRGMREVQALTGEIEIQNTNSIIMFGQQASENISKVSDALLNSMKSVKAEEAGEMLINLTKIMDKFDVGELENVKEGSMISKLFKGVGNTVAKLFQKYDTMGYEVEKVYVLLKKYENDIKESNANLKKLYDGNLEFYQLLEKYIVAGEIALEEIDSYINQISMDNSMNQEEKQMMIQKLEISKEMLSQRVYDLQIAENVAIQAAPMIQTIQLSNFNLMRKINSSFIVTLPIFKQCLAQAVILKRQEIQAKSIKQLDDKTNELIMRNATNTARQSVEIAKMASSSSVSIETLEKSYDTIMKGIEETKAIQEANKVQRNENSIKLENLKHNMKKNIASA